LGTSITLNLPFLLESIFLLPYDFAELNRPQHPADSGKNDIAHKQSRHETSRYENNHRQSEMNKNMRRQFT
jgi:hypothetical protein